MEAEAKKAYMKVYNKKYRAENKLKIQQSLKDYYKANSSKIIARSTKRNKDNISERRVYTRNWNANNKEKRRGYYLRRVYSLTVEGYKELLLIQGGRCAICLEKKDRLYIDHSHTTNEIRGLLCVTCNAGLGQFADKIELLEKAKAYLSRFLGS